MQNGQEILSALQVKYGGESGKHIWLLFEKSNTLTMDEDSKCSESSESYGSYYFVKLNQDLSMDSLPAILTFEEERKKRRKRSSSILSKEKERTTKR